MDAKSVLKAILHRKGTITISESDLKRFQDEQIGMIETWDDAGNKTYVIYTHKKRDHRD
jgi:hypothetical protein